MESDLKDELSSNKKVDKLKEMYEGSGSKQVATDKECNNKFYILNK